MAKSSEKLNFPCYDRFFNPSACELVHWLHEEANTTKRAKLYRTACKLEKRFREYHDLSDRAVRWARRGLVSLPMSMDLFQARSAPPPAHGRASGRANIAEDMQKFTEALLGASEAIASLRQMVDKVEAGVEQLERSTKSNDNGI